MDALPLNQVQSLPDLLRRYLIRAVAIVTTGSIATAALVLIGRRFAGGLLEPLSTTAAAATGICLAGTNLLVCWLSLADAVDKAKEEYRGFGFASFAFITIVSLALAGAVSIRGTPGWGLVFLWGPLLAAAAGWAVYLLRTKPHAEIQREEITSGCYGDEPDVANEPDPPVYQSSLPQEDICRHIERGRTDDGRDTCFGWVRAVFQPRQNIEIIHLVFCPPFVDRPQLEVEHLEGPDFDIKLPQILPYGARIELRLSQPGDETASVTVGFTAIEDEKGVDTWRQAEFG